MTLRSLHRIVGRFPFAARNNVESIVFIGPANVPGQYFEAENGKIYASDVGGWELLVEVAD